MAEVSSGTLFTDSSLQKDNWEMGCRRKLPQTKKAGFYHVNKKTIGTRHDTQPINASY
jgi:hypothetical protein